ncbi:MAG: TRAP transporter substrate-binding protein [Pseudomonadota bacterium]
MDRRRLLHTAPFAAAALAATPARAQERFAWNMVMPWPKQTPGLGINAQRFAELVGIMSGGRLAITVYGAGELVPPFESFDALQSGTADVMHGTPYYWSGKAPALQFFTTTPFGLLAEELQAWLYKGDGMALWREVYEPFGVIPFYAGNSRIQAGGWFNREITSVDDFNGLKMRIAGLGGDVLRRLGVNTVLIAPGDIGPSLMAGTVDAAEWVGPWNDRAAGLQQAATYYYVPAFHEPGAGLEISVNQASFEALPDDLRAIVEVCAQAIATETTADFAFNNIMSFEPLMAEGVELRTWPDDVVDALAAETRAVLTELAATSPLAGRIHSSLDSFRQAANGYGQAFDEQYLAMRARAMAT